MEKQLITAPETRDIPLSKLVPSPLNVRRHPHSKIEALADNILAVGLLHNLTVRPEFDGEQQETGRFEVTAGGGRLGALKLLASRKRIAKNAPIRCSVREIGSAREVSLAENVMREELHPADQFEAFKDLQTDGIGIDDIAARFGVTPRVVKERLKLGAVSPNLLERYRAGELNLEQLMAFTVCDDHARQDEVWEGLLFNKAPDLIRRTLLKLHVSPNDKRVRFIGLDAYTEAGGAIVRDLFTEDGGGYVADVLLLEKLAHTKLEQSADKVREEGWKWVVVSLDHPTGQDFGRVYPREVELSDSDQARLDELETELDAIGGEIEDAEEPDPGLTAKAETLETEYRDIEARSRTYSPETFAYAGAFVFIDYHGGLEIARGFVRPEDKPKERDPQTANGQERAEPDIEAGNSQALANEDEDEHSGYSEQLVAELTAHRTMALRALLGANIEIALVALTHAFAAKTFYAATSQSCLEISPHTIALEHIASGIADTPSAHTVADRHIGWASRLPEDNECLWQFVCRLDTAERLALLAHCISLTVNTIERPNAARGMLAHGRELESALALNMRDFWAPTATAYLERVSKAMILDAVREAVSDQAAENLKRLKKPDMAAAAEKLVLATSWLPALLRSEKAAEKDGLVQQPVPALAAE